MQNNNSFSQIIRNILTLGLPLLFGSIMRYAYQIADSAMLGHYGDQSFELAAIGIAGMFTWILNTFIWPLSSGVQAITSRRFGRQVNEDQKSRHFTGEALDNGLITAIYATVLALCCSFLAKPILGALLKTPEILNLSLQYIAIIRFALLPTGILFVIQGFFGAINKTRYVMFSGIVSNIVNIALNYVLIFGKFGFPKMGIQGAALGTLISLTFASIFLVTVLFVKGYHKQYHLFTFSRLRLQIQKDIVRISLPPAIQNIVALAIFMTYQTIIEDYSPILLAATHSVFSYFRLNKTIIGGFSRSAAILAGNALGRGEKDQAQRIISGSGLLGICISACIVVITIVFSNSIGAIFSSSAGTVQSIAGALRFFAPFFFIEGIGYSFEMVFIANGYGKYVLFSEFSTNMLFILGATLLARHFIPGNIHYAWLAFGMYQIVHALILSIGYFRRKWLLMEVDSETT